MLNSLRRQAGKTVSAIFAVFFLAAGVLPVLGAGSFETKLDTAFALQQGKRYGELENLLRGSGASKNLEDLRQFLLAECLRNTGREAEALAILDGLAGGDPTLKTSSDAAFQLLLLASRVPGRLPPERAENLAADLPTAYQRGRGLEAVMDMVPAPPREKARLALASLRAYGADSTLSGEFPESRSLLEKIIGNSSGFAFTRDEWMEVLMAANRSGLAPNAHRLAYVVRPALGKTAEDAVTLIEADSLSAIGKKDRGLALIDQRGRTFSADPVLQSLSRFIRGEILFRSNRFAEAAIEFETALAAGKEPHDGANVPEAPGWRSPRGHLPAWSVTARYRGMQSAFRADRDELAIVFATALADSEVKSAAFPAALYEMGLARYDVGACPRAISYFRLLAERFPGHYRADDGLAYSALCLSPESTAGKTALKELRSRYPHSFFLYWLEPSARTSRIPSRSFQVPPDQKVSKRLGAWKVLFRSQFSTHAREEIRRAIDRDPGDFGLVRAVAEVAAEAGDYNLVTGYGEILLRNVLETRKTSAEMPDWGWKIYYPRPFWAKIQAEAARSGLDPFWVLSIMREESHFNPKTLSKSNAMSLMQILPSTGKWIHGKLGLKGKFKKETLWNQDLNIRFGAWYLGYLRDLFAGDLFLAAAAYNGGQGNIQRKVENGPYKHLSVLSRLDRVPLPETRDYYKKVMGSWWNYRRLYQ